MIKLRTFTIRIKSKAESLSGSAFFNFFFDNKRFGIKLD